MSKPRFAFGLALLATCSHLAFAQIQSTATGGAGGQGGSASGGSASGGSATATGGTNTSTGGTAKGGSGGSASGGTASAQGGTVTGVSTGSINSSGTGNSQSADVTVNYIQPSATAGGIKGLAAGVDPETNHYVNDNNVKYSGSQTIKNTPDVSVGGPASGPCNGFSGGVGVSVAGFAVGANASTVDKGCEARETARIAAMLGRMDIANAVLEHISVVEEALKAKAEREAAKNAALTVPAPVNGAPAQEREQTQQRRPSEADAETARLAEQQKLASAALQRKSTMDKVNDTITFTTAANQEKTPQQTMAEQAAKQQADLVARAEKQALESAGGAAQAPAAIASAAASPSQPSPNSVSAPPPSTAPATSAAPPHAVAGNAASAAVAAAAPGSAAAQQSQQLAKSPASIASTNGAQANASTTAAAVAQPNANDDQVRKLLGFAAPPPTLGTTSTASQPADDHPTTIAARDAKLAGAKAQAPAGPNGSNNPAAKGQQSDPTGIAKLLLNVK